MLIVHNFIDVLSASSSVVKELLSLRLSDHFALVVGCINNNWLNLWKKMRVRCSQAFRLLSNCILLAYWHCDSVTVGWSSCWVFFCGQVWLPVANLGSHSSLVCNPKQSEPLRYFPMASYFRLNLFARTALFLSSSEIDRGLTAILSALRRFKSSVSLPLVWWKLSNFVTPEVCRVCQQRIAVWLAIMRVKIIHEDANG